MRDNLNHRGLAWPLLLVGIGLLLLGSNLGWFEASLWSVLLRAWPLILVVVGIDLLMPRRSLAGTAVTGLLIAGVLAGGLWLATTAGRPLIEPSEEAIAVPLGDPGAADVEIRPAVGQLLVEPGSPSGSLVEASIALLRGERLEKRVEQAGGRQRVVLRSQGVFLAPGPNGAGLPWRVRLNPSSPISLELGLGVGEIHFDGSSLTLSRLTADLGVGQMDLRLGPGIERVEARLGIGEIRIVVPPGAPVRVQASAALGGRNLPAGYLREGDWYLSPGSVPASDRIEIRASVGIGEVRLTEGG